MVGELLIWKSDMIIVVKNVGIHGAVLKNFLDALNVNQRILILRTKSFYETP